MTLVVCAMPLVKKLSNGGILLLTGVKRVVTLVWVVNRIRFFVNKQAICVKC